MLPTGVQQNNHAYVLWVRVDQLVRAWIFVALSKDTLTNARDVPHSLSVWSRLESHFNTASLARHMDLQQTLTNLDKPESQSIG